ncbi:MAG TPA: HAD hydrolase family protein [Candidatus Brocadiia bacterium]|nr:HAD hydrolase family protein [Candidatus Brocadiia bacterium]
MAGPENVKLVISDVDGVLTDGTVVYTEGGEQIMTFCVADGAGSAYLARAGIPVALMSGRNCRPVVHRAREMGIREVRMGLESKTETLDEILKEFGVGSDEVCYIGDDFKDVPAMRRVGFPVAVADARPEVKKVAAWVTEARGGRGALREVAERILRAQGKWADVVRRYELPDQP